jgi:DNA primase
MDRELVPVPTAQGLIRFEERLAADIRIASLPEGRDPDEVIRDDPAAWAGLVADARPILDYYFRALTADLDLTTARGKAEAVNRLAPLVATLGQRVQREHYMQQLSRLVQVDERALVEQIRQSSAARRPAPPVRSARPAPGPERAAERVTRSRDEFCLAAALAHPDMLEDADRALADCGEVPLQPDDMARAEDRAIFAAWRQELAERGTAGTHEAFAGSLDAALQSRLEDLAEEHAAQPQVADDLLRDKVLEAVLHLRRDNLSRRNRNLRFLQEDAQAVGDREATLGYGQTIRELSARIGRLDRALEARSMMGRRRREDAALRVPLAEE